ncbi:MAG: bifunctional phosphopantothenoylcysteine decarboxylase/phosphopantothenate--cysteine ligase CoaBC [Bacteroidetes bacterium]|nr:bifunctional phosphopantothenoylcysteine decarboxylase/phosphopantothenate--cysteine ligase CoaBC [Bacteroidota bacterium]
MLAGKKIIVGITGSIAAYKAALMVRLFVKNGAEVRVVMTEAAKQFVGSLTFSNLSQQPVFSGLWDGNWTEHVHLGAWGDLMVVAPASANTLSKFALGICDNALTAVYLSAKCPVLVAPAMDADMYQHPSTFRNLNQLKKDGVQVLGVGTGFLASGLVGEGRMAEPEDILEAVINHFGPRPLHGKKVLVSAGPTREAIDPVRFISNGSTGTMGYALARQAANLGATVTLVSGPVALSPDGPWELINVNSAAEMFVAMTSRSADQDLIIMTAAVGDYQPVEFSPTKIKKADKNLVLELGRTQDILRHLGDTKPAGQVLVGFALETNDEEAHALDKMKRKNLDFIVLNSLRDSGAGFGGSTNKVTVFGRDGQKQSFELKGKVEVAADILNAVCKTIQQ